MQVTESESEAKLNSLHCLWQCSWASIWGESHHLRTIVQQAIRQMKDICLAKTIDSALPAHSSWWPLKASTMSKKLASRPVEHSRTCGHLPGSDNREHLINKKVLSILMLWHLGAFLIYIIDCKSWKCLVLSYSLAKHKSKFSDHHSLAIWNWWKEPQLPEILYSRLSKYHDQSWHRPMTGMRNYASLVTFQASIWC